MHPCCNFPAAPRNGGNSEVWEWACGEEEEARDEEDREGLFRRRYCSSFKSGKCYRLFLSFQWFDRRRYYLNVRVALRILNCAFPHVVSHFQFPCWVFELRFESLIFDVCFELAKEDVSQRKKYMKHDSRSTIQRPRKCRRARATRVPPLTHARRCRWSSLFRWAESSSNPS